MPGYVFSPDLVVQDSSGFVPILYRQPLPFARALFGLLRAGKYSEQGVLVRGWYRRGPSPVLELREVVAADGTRSRSWQWVAAYARSGGLLLAGLIAAAAMMTA